MYTDWIEDVKRTVPPDQLLVFNVKEGWEPLCNFVGVLVPDTPFPRLNDTAQFTARMDMLSRITWMFVGAAAAALGGSAMEPTR